MSWSDTTCLISFGLWVYWIWGFKNPVIGECQFQAFLFYWLPLKYLWSSYTFNLIFFPVSEKGAGLNLAGVYYCLDLTEATTTDIWGFRGRYTAFIYAPLSNLKKSKYFRQFSISFETAFLCYIYTIAHVCVPCCGIIIKNPRSGWIKLPRFPRSDSKFGQIWCRNQELRFL